MNVVKGSRYYSFGGKKVGTGCTVEATADGFTLSRGDCGEKVFAGIVVVVGDNSKRTVGDSRSDWMCSAFFPE